MMSIYQLSFICFKCFTVLIDFCLRSFSSWFEKWIDSHLNLAPLNPSWSPNLATSLGESVWKLWNHHGENLGNPHVLRKPSNWVIGSLGHWVIGSLGHWVIGSLGHWVIGSLGHWVIGSLGHWVIGSLGHWVGSIFGDPPGFLGWKTPMGKPPMGALDLGDAAWHHDDSWAPGTLWISARWEDEDDGHPLTGFPRGRHIGFTLVNHACPIWRLMLTKPKW